MIKKAAIYDPYLDTLGGGERYCLSVAEILLKNGYQVDLFWSGNRDLIIKAQERFSLNLDGLNIVPDIFGIVPKKIEMIDDNQSLPTLSSKQRLSPGLFKKLSNFINKYQVTKKYDIFFFLSDGSIPFIFSKYNILHIQVPFVKYLSLPQKIFTALKSLLINKTICNSNFTARFTKNYLNKNVCVLYPPVDVSKFKPGQKENIILSVGRFDNILNSKKQDVLIEAFKLMVEKNNLRDWRLVLAGGSLSDESKNSYLNHLKHISQGFPIEFHVNPSFESLQKIYSSAKIYWHAAGYGVEENNRPQETEHFGITVVEAMASGQVPVVVAKGGLPEIVTDNQEGYLWNTVEELTSKTQLLIASPQEISRLSTSCQEKCKMFSKEIFEKNLLVNLS